MTDTPKIQPASESDISRWKSVLAHQQCKEPGRCDWCRLLARIDSDRARIRELEERSGCEHCSDRRRQAEADLDTARGQNRAKDEEIARLVAVLTRLGSMEAFDVGTCHVSQEIIKRVDYARAALAEQPKEKESKR